MLLCKITARFNCFHSSVDTLRDAWPRSRFLQTGFAPPCRVSGFCLGVSSCLSSPSSDPQHLRGWRDPTICLPDRVFEEPF